MILVAASAFGSHSRGALLAIAAMSVVLWWRGRNRFLTAIMMVCVGLAMLSFMPEHWTERMGTIKTYQEDESAMGRFAAWWVAWGIAKDYVFGVGFNASRPELFELYSPLPDLGTPVAHSIYFQVLGLHGFIGLFLFLGLWFSTFWWAARIRREARGIPQATWCVDLANMVQVSLVGYAVGGAFLSLAYFDLPYNLMVLIVLTRLWVRHRAWETEPVHRPGWLTLPGLVSSHSPATPPKTATAAT
jgi:putative inorganic carbon (hco3(-)) transporter